MNDDLYITFTETIAQKVFGGYLPQNVSPELLSVAILDACVPFQGCSAEIKRYFLLRLVPLIYFRQKMQQDAGETDRGAQWKS